MKILAEALILVFFSIFLGSGLSLTQAYISIYLLTNIEVAFGMK
jgi:hypothetical protein